MKKRDFIRFERYLDGNPAMLEIWVDALDRIEKNTPLSPVQAVVLREWINLALARKNHLELEAQNDFLTDEEYAELASLKSQIPVLQNFREE